MQVRIATTPDAEISRRPLARRRYTTLLVLAAYVLLALSVFHLAWVAPTTRNIGTSADPMFTMWTLVWTPFALAHGHSPLFTDYLNFPFGVNLMWNAFIPLQSTLLWPITALAGPVFSYNILVTANVALTAWCGYLAVGTLVPDRRAAFVGGLLYGFSPYMMAQSLDHPTLTAGYMPALLLLILHEMLVRQKHPAWQAGLALGIWTAAQLLIWEEGLAIQALVTAIGLTILVALQRRRVAERARHAATSAGIAAIVFLALAAAPLHFQFFGPQRITGGTVQQPNTFVSDLANFVVPTEVQQLAPSRAQQANASWTGNLSEWNAYLGVPLIAVLLVTVVKLRRRPVVRFAGLLAVVTALLSLGPSLHVNGHDTGVPLPWRLIEPAPLLGYVLPARLMLPVFLMLAVLVAAAAEHVLGTRPWKTKGAGLAMGAAAGAMVLSLLPTLRFPANHTNIPSFFTDGSARIIPEGSVALIAPMQQLYPAEPMAWQAVTGMRFKMPQGYFFAPDEEGRPRYGAPFSLLTLTMYEAQDGRKPQLTPELRTEIAADLGKRRVETVVVGPMAHQLEMVDLFQGLFRTRPERYGDSFVWVRTQRLLR